MQPCGANVRLWSAEAVLIMPLRCIDVGIGVAVSFYGAERNLHSPRWAGGVEVAIEQRNWQAHVHLCAEHPLGVVGEQQRGGELEVATIVAHTLVYIVLYKHWPILLATRVAVAVIYQVHIVSVELQCALQRAFIIVYR